MKEFLSWPHLLIKWLHMGSWPLVWELLWFRHIQPFSHIVYPRNACWSTSSADGFGIEPAAGVSRWRRTPRIVDGPASISYHVWTKVHQIAKVQVSTPAIWVQDDVVGLPITLGVNLDVLIEARKCQIPSVEGQVGSWEPPASSSGVVHGFGKEVKTIVNGTKKGRNLKFRSMRKDKKKFSDISHFVA